MNIYVNFYTENGNNAVQQRNETLSNFSWQAAQAFFSQEKEASWCLWKGTSASSYSELS